MDKYTATELAFKHGYEKGYEAGKKFATDNNVGRKKKYEISNVGCDDVTEGVFEFTDQEAEFLDRFFTELNKMSYYGCMPTIYIKCVDQEGE